MIMYYIFPGCIISISSLSFEYNLYKKNGHATKKDRCSGIDRQRVISKHDDKNDKKIISVLKLISKYLPSNSNNSL